MLQRTFALSALFALTLALTAHAQTPVVEAENDDGATPWQLNEDAGFVLFGEYDAGTGTIPAEGNGARLLWHPEKAAFRAGYINDGGNEWDDDNIGNSSTTLGANTEASGNNSTALGTGTEASGYASTALGINTKASGDWSTAIGHNATASSDHSKAMDHYTTAATEHSLTTGRRNDANQTDDGTLFVVGNGEYNARSDALVLDDSGDLEIAGSLTESSDHRPKTDISPLNESVLDALSEIQAVRYRFREDTGHPADDQIGLIAQEAQAQFPELVTEDAGGHLSLSYTKLTAVLVKGLQEQQAENEALEARVAALEHMMQGRSPAAAGLSGYAPLLASVQLLLGGTLVLHRRRSDA